MSDELDLDFYGYGDECFAVETGQPPIIPYAPFVGKRRNGQYIKIGEQND